MKRILLISIILFVCMGFTYNRNNTNVYLSSIDTQKKELLDSIPKDDVFKRDMLESILEFADENTPIDSLYIPDWIFN